MADPMETSNPHETNIPEKPVPTLDDEALNKILHLAGTAATLRARSVNKQWRRVATDILNNVRFIQLSRLFPNIPTSATVQSTLKVFSRVDGVTIRDWPYTHVYPCIADELTIANLPFLKELELTGVHITPSAIGQLVLKPTVRFLTLGNHDSVNRDAVSAMVTAKRTLHGANPSDANGRARYLLDRLVFKRARCLEGLEISSASMSYLAQEIVAMGCPNIRNAILSCDANSISRSQRIYETYSMTNCRNLKELTVNISARSNDCCHINLSQCTQLSHITFMMDSSRIYAIPTVVMSDLRELNLSGCRELRKIIVARNQNEFIIFPNLERVILFGARKLLRTNIQGVFGFSLPIPMLPRLIRLDLNGTIIDKLVLQDYPLLMYVDVSGCMYLDFIDVRECWQLKSFLVLGKRAPLRRVNMILSLACKVEGRREAWHWQTQASHQAISFP